MVERSWGAAGHEPVIDFGGSNGEERATLKDILYVGRTLAHGVRLVAQEPLRELHERVKTAIGLSKDAQGTEYVTPNGTLTERFKRASGFVLWRLDGTKPPQESDLRELHRRELVYGAIDNLVDIGDAVVGKMDDEESTNPWVVDFKTRGGLTACFRDDVAGVRFEYSRHEGRTGNIISVLEIPHDRFSEVPIVYSIDSDSGFQIDVAQPATLRDVNAFTRELNTSSYL